MERPNEIKVHETLGSLIVSHDRRRLSLRRKRTAARSLQATTAETRELLVAANRVRRDGS